MAFVNRADMLFNSFNRNLDTLAHGTGIRRSLDKFLYFFRMSTFIDSTNMKL